MAEAAERAPMAEAAERVFTARRGYMMADTGTKGEYQKWAHFTRDPEREERNGPMVFSFTTPDAKVAARLAEMSESHGISEVTA